MMTRVNLDQARKALDNERTALVRQLKELGADERGELTGEMEFEDAFADAGAATAERNETLTIIENLKTELDDIDAALVQLAEGTYGICVDCGEPIPVARLEFRPNSVRCVSCKASVS
ncbi:MAG: TraR/DksA family transcriptional regulator [Armatimonadetes bacterium]|nr:MAG: TraR/DksA family transcriptional regulator [Armatimonadota bacterium]